MTAAETLPARSVARQTGALAICVGGMVLVGWALDIVALKSILPGGMTMTPNTALGFILIGLALLFSYRPPSSVDLNESGALLDSRPSSLASPVSAHRWRA